MAVRVVSVDHPDLPSFPMPERFRHDVTYFASHQSRPGQTLADGEWWVDKAEAQEALTDGVFRVVSPLDSSIHAEIEISEEQEAWLAWIVANDIQRIRLE